MIKNVFLKSLFLILLTATCIASPFDYDLRIQSIQGSNSRTMVCCHGLGGNYRIGQSLQSLGIIDATLVSFNFPDHDLRKKLFNPYRATFGTINEVLPAIYVLNQCVTEKKLTSLDLYGFSAGGGAIINILAVLNTTIYDKELQQIGVGAKDKEQILKALQNGIVILDTPLKSLEEIIDLRGSTPELNIIVKKYITNGFTPLTALEQLKGLSLDVIVHFQNPDEIIYNRDDDLFIKKLKAANRLGTTSVIIGYDGGHIAPHWSLWNYYSKKIQMNQRIDYTQRKLKDKYVIGIAIKTSNSIFQDHIPQFWNKFYKEKIAERIPGKVNQNILAVYTNYEGDHTQPFTYLIGCEVANLDNIPDGMVGIKIPSADYAVFTAKGDFPNSIAEAWKAVWNSHLDRAFKTDFEVYPANFNPATDTDIPIYIGLKEIDRFYE